VTLATEVFSAAEKKVKKRTVKEKGGGNRTKKKTIGEEFAAL